MRVAASKLANFKYRRGDTADIIMALESNLSALLIQGHSSGFFSSPTTYELDYLNVYQQYPKALELLLDHRTGIYTLDNIRLLRYAISKSSVASGRKFLEACYKVLEVKERLKHFKNLYNSSKTEVMRTIVPGVDFSKEVVYRGVDLGSRYSVTMPQDIEVVSAAFLIYNYLNEKHGITKKKDTWTFIKGMSREKELDFIPLILEGVILTDTPEGRSLLSHYEIDDFSEFVDLELELLTETRASRLELFDKVAETDLNLSILGFNDWEIYLGNYEDVENFKTTSYIIPMVYNLDTNEYLHQSNVLLGLGGVYTRRQQYVGQRTTALVGLDGEILNLYRVRDKYFEYLDLMDNSMDFKVRKSGIDDEVWAYWMHRINNNNRKSSRVEALSSKYPFDLKHSVELFKQAYSDICDSKWDEIYKVLYINVGFFDMEV